MERSDTPRSELAELVAPSLDRIGRLMRREDLDGPSICIILTRAEGGRFTPDSTIAVGAANLEGLAELEEAGDNAGAKALVDAEVFATMLSALNAFAESAGIDVQIIRPEDN